MNLIYKVQRDISINILIAKKICYLFRILRHLSEFLNSACTWDEIQKRIVRVDENVYMGLSF